MCNRVSFSEGRPAEDVSLDAQPFAAAMNALTPMPGERRALTGERLLALAASDRKELVDPGFGDVEFSWWPRDQVGEWPVLEPDAKQPLAVGYDGSTGAELVLLDEDAEPLAKWTGEAAQDLIKLGRFAGRERNE